jgi:hypothetical protein
MKNFILFVSILLIFTSCEVEQDTLIPENVEQAILAKEHQALVRWSAGDPLGFAVNFANEATYFDDIAAHTRLDGLEEIKKHLGSLEGKIPAHNYEIVDPKVQVFGGVAILTLHYQGSTADEQPLPQWKATSVYNFINDDWQVVHAHWSLVKE